MASSITSGGDRDDHGGIAAMNVHPSSPSSSSSACGSEDGSVDPFEDLSIPSIENFYEIFDRFFSSIAASTSGDRADGDSSAGVPRPAARSYVESIPGIEITEDSIASDPSLTCAICKEEFVVRSEGKKLICGHIYHQDCILPWLSSHSSCPVCRFRLPSDDPLRRRRSAVTAVDIGDDRTARDVRDVHRILMALFPGRNSPPAEVDFLGFEPTLRRISATHGLDLSGRSSRDDELGFVD
ncbi:E3 ubiquitin-protein ligase SIRP1-like [Wolffia australiana]